MPNTAIYKSLAVVIPALNEATTIGNVIIEVKSIADVIIIVDDGSIDGTGDIARELGAEVVRHNKPLGYDAAIAAGLNFAFSNPNIVAAVTCDADGQHRAVDIRNVSSQVIEGGFDYCAGVRNHYNRAIEVLLGVLSIPLFGTRDPFCGLRCYHRKVFERFGKFPSEMNIGTLPMAWVKKSELKSTFTSIQVNKRKDHPRFAKQLKANWMLSRAFFRSANYFINR